MTKIVTYILISIIFLFSCSSSENKVIVEQSNLSNIDTIISLTVDNVKKTFIVHKELHLNLAKFQSFLIEYPSIPSEYIDTLFVDITGDGVDEKVISKIETKNGDCIIYSTILKDKKIIRCDTLNSNNEIAFMDWANDSIYFKLKPYTSFFDAIRDKNVIQDLDSGQINEDLIQFYVSGLKYQLIDKGYDSTSVNIRIDSVANSLRQYKGKLVTTLEHWDRSLLIWNCSTNKFELLYSP